MQRKAELPKAPVLEHFSTQSDKWEIHDLLKADEGARVKLILSYLDDTYTIVRPENVEVAYLKLQSYSKEHCGLEFNTSKSYALFKHWNEPRYQAIALLLSQVLNIEPITEGAKAVGAPVGTDAFRRDFARDTAEKKILQIRKVTEACRFTQEQWVMLYQLQQIIVSTHTPHNTETPSPGGDRHF